MSCFKLRFTLFPITAVLVIYLLVCQSPAALALQMPMAKEPAKKEVDDDPDLMRVEWLKLNPTGSRAMFEMPTKPRFVERTLTPVKGKPPIKVRMYIAAALENTVTFTVNYNDMSKAPRGGKGVENTLEGVVRGSVTNVSGQLFSKTKIALKGMQGRQFAYGFTDTNGQQYIALSRAFIRGKRLFQLTAVEAVTDPQLYNEEVAGRFLNSFQIARAKSDLPPVPKAPPKSETNK